MILSFAFLLDGDEELCVHLPKDDDLGWWVEFTRKQWKCISYVPIQELISQLIIDIRTVSLSETDFITLDGYKIRKNTIQTETKVTYQLTIEELDFEIYIIKLSPSTLSDMFNNCSHFIEEIEVHLHNVGGKTKTPDVSHKMILSITNWNDFIKLREEICNNINSTKAHIYLMPFGYRL